MHELAITKQITEIAIRYGEQNDASKITDLYLIIGDLSSVIDDSVQFYWDIIAEDTICEGANLHFERIPAKLQCQKCGHEYTLKENEITYCPQCQSSDVRIIQGKEFQLQSINIEK